VLKLKKRRKRLLLLLKLMNKGLLERKLNAMLKSKISKSRSMH
jgi:hypothetical protein